MPPRTDNTAQDAYARQYLDQALLSEKGIQLSYPDTQTAFYVRHGMYRARKVDRDMNKRAYANDKENPLYNKSPYDHLVIRLKTNPDGTATLQILKQEFGPTPTSIQEIA